jgi:hypothetical protein
MGYKPGPQVPKKSLTFDVSLSRLRLLTIFDVTQDDCGCRLSFRACLISLTIRLWEVPE